MDLGNYSMNHGPNRGMGVTAATSVTHGNLQKLLLAFSYRNVIYCLRILCWYNDPKSRTLSLCTVSTNRNLSAATVPATGPVGEPYFKFRQHESHVASFYERAKSAVRSTRFDKNESQADKLIFRKFLRSKVVSIQKIIQVDKIVRLSKYQKEVLIGIFLVTWSHDHKRPHIWMLQGNYWSTFKDGSFFHQCIDVNHCYWYYACNMAKYQALFHCQMYTGYYWGIIKPIRH